MQALQGAILFSRRKTVSTLAFPAFAPLAICADRMALLPFLPHMTTYSF
jgi:hypothetical protein